MNLPELCIRRPVMTTLLTAAVLLFGAIGYAILPTAALPRVDFPTIAVTALLPGVFNLAPLGFSQGYLTQIMAGDVLVAFLALVSFALIQLRSDGRIAFAWVFNVVGTLDYLNAAAQVTPAITDANILGPFGWIIVTVFLPAWLVSHIAIFFVLLRNEDA